MDDLCSEDGQRVYDKKDCCVVSRLQKYRFLWYNFLFEQINQMRTTVQCTVHVHPQLSLKCRLPNRNSFDVFDRCFCKDETRACETLRSCTKRLMGLEVTTLPGASRSFNPALSRGRCWTVIRLSHHLEPSAHAVDGEVDGLDIGWQHSQRCVLVATLISRKDLGSSQEIFTYGCHDFARQSLPLTARVYQHAWLLQ